MNKPTLLASAALSSTLLLAIACGSDTPANPGISLSSSSGAPMSSSSGGSMTFDGGEPTWVNVQAQFKAACTPCHSTGMSGGHQMAQTDVALAFADSQLDSTSCSGKKKGACAADRIRSGQMPLGGGLAEPVRTGLSNLIDAWVAAGQPGPTAADAGAGADGH